VSNRIQSERVRCRNQRCRSKLATPTSNDHKAFCTPYCYQQFYNWRCKVCERPILKGKRRKYPNHCHSAECRRDFRRFSDTFSYPKSPAMNGGSQAPNYDLRSAHKTGVKSAHKSPAAYRIIAGPPLSDRAAWAATLSPATPPGISRELAQRDAADAEYLKADAARLRSMPVDASGNYELES